MLIILLLVYWFNITRIHCKVSLYENKQLFEEKTRDVLDLIIKTYGCIDTKLNLLYDVVGLFIQCICVFQSARSDLVLKQKTINTAGTSLSLCV